MVASRSTTSREHILPPNFLLEPVYITSNADVVSAMRICCGWRILLSLAACVYYRTQIPLFFLFFFFNFGYKQDLRRNAKDPELCFSLSH